MSAASSNPTEQRKQATEALLEAVKEYEKKKAARTRTAIVDNKDFFFDRDGFLKEMTRYIINNKKLDTKKLSSIIYQNFFSEYDMGSGAEAVRNEIERAFTPELIEILENQTKHVQNKMLRENAWEGIRKPTDIKFLCSTIASICKFIFYSIAEKFRNSKATNVAYKIADKIEQEKDWALSVESALMEEIAINGRKIAKLGEGKLPTDKELKANEDLVSAVTKFTKHIDQDVRSPSLHHQDRSVATQLGNTLREANVQGSRADQSTAPLPSAPPMPDGPRRTQSSPSVSGGRSKK